MVELPWGDEWVEQEIREGLLEDEQWAPMGVARPVPGEYFEQFGGVLPSSVLYVWRCLGFEGFGGGRFWITDPLEWAPAVEAWLEDVVLPFPEQSWWCLGRTALGQMCLWGEVSGPALIIDALDGFLNPDADNAEKMADPVARERMGCILFTEPREDFDVDEPSGRPLADVGLERLGPLGADQVLGFAPPLFMTGRCEAGLLEVQEAVPHLMFLAQTGERRLGVDYSEQVDAVIERFDLARPFTPDEADDDDSDDTADAAGSAGWGTAHDIRRFTDNRSRDLLLTKTESLGLDPRRIHRNLNVLLIGSSGSGKSHCFVIPNLCQANTSFVVTDPKGEAMVATGDKLQRLGYEIRCLNLIDFAQSDTFNPLAYFNPEQAEIDCMLLAEAFISNTAVRNPTDASDICEKAERALLTALIIYVHLTKGPEGTLLDVVDLLAAMSTSEKDEDSASEIDILFNEVSQIVAEYDQNLTLFDEDATQMVRGLRFAWSQYNVYTQSAGERATRNNIIASLGARMTPLHIASVRRILSSDSIDIDQICQRPTAIFLVTPDTHQTFDFLTSIFYETLLERSIYIADHNGGRLCIPMQCFMDDFASAGRIPSFERKISAISSRGISTAVIVQNYAQGKSLYKDGWETIVDNCDSLLFLGGNETSTTEFISNRLGKETITPEDSREQESRSDSWSRSWRSTGRELLTPDEVSRLPGHECLYLLRGLPPFRSRKLTAPETGNFTYTPRPVTPSAVDPDWIG